MEMVQFAAVVVVLAALAIHAQGVCVHNEIEYKEGEQYIDDCNTCLCSASGNGACTRRGCPPKVCKANGKMYGVGEQFLDASKCNRCTCGENGLAACTLKLC